VDSEEKVARLECLIDPNDFLKVSKYDEGTLDIAIFTRGEETSFVELSEENARKLKDFLNKHYPQTLNKTCILFRMKE